MGAGQILGVVIRKTGGGRGQGHLGQGEMQFIRADALQNGHHILAPAFGFSQLVQGGHAVGVEHHRIAHQPALDQLLVQ